ncbi:hypothetical protein Vretimale_9071 [Volvox reticuliferus]|nr:hypothetical protein Vretimale_9071 [Volvox reticuliferus]
MVIDTGVLANGYRRVLEDSEAPALLREVCFAISNIAAGTQDQAITVLDAGLPPLLVRVLKRCGGSDAVHREATWVLSNLATKGLPSLASAVREAGAAAPLSEYLSSHAAKSQRADVAANVAAAEALLAMAQAGSLRAGDAEDCDACGGDGDNADGGDGDGSGGAAADAAAATAAAAAVNPAVADYASNGVYDTLQRTVDRGLLSGKALMYVKRLLQDFPPPDESRRSEGS